MKPNGTRFLDPLLILQPYIHSQKSLTMSAPQKVQPAYLGPDGGRPEPPSAWDMLKAQVLAPEYRESNLA